MNRSSRRGACRPRRARPGLRLEALETRETPAVVAALDPSFGTAGTVTLSNTPFHDIAVQADGKILTVGTNGDFLIANFGTDCLEVMTRDGSHAGQKI